MADFFFQMLVGDSVAARKMSWKVSLGSLARICSQECPLAKAFRIPRDFSPSLFRCIYQAPSVGSCTYRCSSSNA